MDMILENLIIKVFKENEVVVDNERENSYIIGLLSDYVTKNNLDINLKDFSDLEIRQSVSYVIKNKKYKTIALDNFLIYYKNYKKLGKYLEKHFKFL